jgi:hypothetical protein
MEVTIDSLEANAVFNLVGPEGQALDGAQMDQDPTSWSGTLPLDGDYLLIVGSTRGNAEYRMEVAITTITPPASTIRSTDWARVLESDPQLRAEQVEGKLYVNVAAQDAQMGGHPVFDAIVYVDMDGDGSEEAAVPLNSGGTAGDIGFLVYQQATPAPMLVAWQTGYKLNLGFEDGQLVVSNALYTGWEANCCPSGLRYTTYTLNGGQLQVTATRDEPNTGMQIAAVERFYSLLNSGDLVAAHALFDDNYRQANPYDAWAAGFANTVNIEATVSVDSAPDTVQVSLTTIDQGADGAQITRRFAGTWRLVWSPTLPGWSLANPQIAEVRG